MEDTTTDAPVESGATTIQGVQVDDQGQAVAVPETTETSTAAHDTVETSDEGAQALPDDDKLQKFAQSHGLELDSPNAIKAAKMAMDNQAEFQRANQKASELEKTMTGVSDDYAEQVAEQTGQDPEVLKRLQRMEVKDAVRDFWSQDGVDRTYEPKMIEILGNKPHLAGDLDALYALAVRDDVKSQGKREALESLAHSQQAAVPTGNAVNSQGSPAAITPQNVDRLVGQNDLAWFEKNREAINRAMAGQ